MDSVVALTSSTAPNAIADMVDVVALPSSASPDAIVDTPDVAEIAKASTMEVAGNEQ